jgi:plastocyanin
MKKNTLIILAGGVLIIGIGAFLFLKPGSDAPGAVVTGEPAVTIVRTATGYEPNEVTIKKGDIILWTNESGEFHWPASDLHPTHGIYPEFDPLVPIAPGDEWKFKFDEVGVWKFHDHIRANEVGTITVTE